MSPTIPTSRRTLYFSIAWCVLWLAFLDVGSGLTLRWLAARSPESGVVRYFAYGRSIEGKLDRSIALPPDARGSLILAAGWLDPAEWATLPAQPRPGTNLLVSVYGQSFALSAAHEAARVDGRMTLRGIGGPAAAPDHSFAAAQLDGPNRKADVLVFGILASAVQRMGAMSGVSATFENPAPFSYPHYSLQNGTLQAEMPPFTTERGFREAFAARSTQWAKFKTQLAVNDRGYDPVAFDRTWLDRSQLVLLMRRGWVAQNQHYGQGVYEPGHGFNDDAEPMRVLRAMLKELGRQTQARNERLIVLLEQDQGYADYLDKALGSTLREARIEYISTYTLFSSQDPRNFVPDGHYTAAANAKLGAALRAMIRSSSTYTAGTK